MNKADRWKATLRICITNAFVDIKCRFYIFVMLSILEEWQILMNMINRMRSEVKHRRVNFQFLFDKNYSWNSTWTLAQRERSRLLGSYLGIVWGRSPAIVPHLGIEALPLTPHLEL